MKFVLFILSLGTLSIPFFSQPAFASPATLKCDANRDQVWVYDSLSSFNVDAKLKCGQSVEIIERVQNYVKIRAHNGVEGYVPDGAIADLAALQPYRDASHDVGLAAKRAQASEKAKTASDAAELAPPDVSYSKLTQPASRMAAPASVSIAPAPALGAPKSSPAPSPAAKPAPKPAPEPAPELALAEGAIPVPAKASAPVTVPLAAAPITPTAPVAPEKLNVAMAAQPPDSAARATKDSVVPAAMMANANEGGDSVDSEHVAEQSRPCQSYFSAYGLTPNQTKWIAQNRVKSFAAICPAPDPSKVDFVMIFTHDVDFFSGTMPDPVHQSGGFSDFTPMTPIDTALIPISQGDNAHREYVWIFQFQKGTFDPATFSAKRRYQFSKMETGSLGSKGSVKTIEDAFRFVASANR